MLLLAAVAIQMAMGENGLIAKSVQAQKQQAKSELYENAKLSYTNLKVKALENGQPIPEAYLALATTEFRDKYDIVIPEKCPYLNIPLTSNVGCGHKRNRDSYSIDRINPKIAILIIEKSIFLKFIKISLLP